MRILYDILLHIAIILLLPYFLFKMAYLGKYRKGISERFGFINKAKSIPLRGKKVIWFHAVSVGETRAALPLLRVFKENHPDFKIVFSTVTFTGNNVAEKEGAAHIDALIYFPLDISWIVKRVVKKINPRLFIVVEKEYWPNMIRVLGRNSTPVIVVNGTISEKSFARYGKLEFFFRPIFNGISLFLAQSEEDRKRAVLLGMDVEKAVLTGNLKFDISPPALDAGKREALRLSLGIKESDTVIVAGSTHPGEEEFLLKAFMELKGEFKGLKLVLAPRHPERFNDVESVVRKTGLKFKRRTQGKEEETDVAILDTIGELSMVYALSTVAFVGGTLIPVGGHNLLEPAFSSKPVIYGPHLKSCLYMASMLETHGASMRVNPGALTEAIRKLLKDPVLREKMGRAGHEAVQENKGATLKTLKAIENIMVKPGHDG